MLFITSQPSHHLLSPSPLYMHECFLVHYSLMMVAVCYRNVGKQVSQLASAYELSRCQKYLATQAFSQFSLRSVLNGIQCLQPKYWERLGSLVPACERQENFRTKKVRALWPKRRQDKPVFHTLESENPTFRMTMPVEKPALKPKYWLSVLKRLDNITFLCIEFWNTNGFCCICVH